MHIRAGHQALTRKRPNSRLSRETSNLPWAKSSVAQLLPGFARQGAITRGELLGFGRPTFNGAELAEVTNRERTVRIRGEMLSQGFRRGLHLAAQNLEPRRHERQVRVGRIKPAR